MSLLKDPKFGYNWVWIYPLALLLKLRDITSVKYTRIRMKWIKFGNPQIRKISKLSGIK